ncbi:MAG: crossover junction endodeoxyribonuclease RuvC [Myxococcota bacterium]
MAGIDPGSQRTGFGVVRVEGSKIVALHHRVIHLPKDDLCERLGRLYDALSEALALHRPDRVVLESVFHQKNARSALVLGHARGVALLVAGRCGARVSDLSPSEVKRAVTGNGRADKHQVQQMVKILLALPSVPAADAADALAVAVAGATMGRAEARFS